MNQTFEPFSFYQANFNPNPPSDFNKTYSTVNLTFFCIYKGNIYTELSDFHGIKKPIPYQE